MQKKILKFLIMKKNDSFFFSFYYIYVRWWMLAKLIVGIVKFIDLCQLYLNKTRGKIKTELEKWPLD